MRNTRAQTTPGTRASEALVAVPAQRMSASAHPFKLQVVLSTSEPAQERRIRSVREAAACLVNDWPQKGRGTAYRAALRACYDALEGMATADSVQRAFMRAALEAGILVRAGKSRRGEGVPPSGIRPACESSIC